MSLRSLCVAAATLLTAALLSPSPASACTNYCDSHCGPVVWCGEPCIHPDTYSCITCGEFSGNCSSQQCQWSFWSYQSNWSIYDSGGWCWSRGLVTEYNPCAGFSSHCVEEGAVCTAPCGYPGCPLAQLRC